MLGCLALGVIKVGRYGNNGCIDCLSQIGFGISFGLCVRFGSSSGLGWINVFELSFDDALDLDLLQAGEFTLFSVLLNAVAIGIGDFSLTHTVFGDAHANNLTIDKLNSTSVNVSGVSVPEPSSLLLLVGMLAIVVLRAKISQSQK